jgi:hypothetical protein
VKPHDIGGRLDFGTIDTHDDGQPFHHEWEARVFAINRMLLLAGATPSNAWIRRVTTRHRTTNAGWSRSRVFSRRKARHRVAFEIGERVRTRAQNAAGHTRLPAYWQRKPGVVAKALGEFPLADERASGRGGAPEQRLYTVRFVARDVWPDAPAGDAIAADLFEAYLEPAP